MNKQFNKVTYSFFRGALKISRINDYSDGIWINSAKSNSITRSKTVILWKHRAQGEPKKQYDCLFREAPKIFIPHEFKT